MAEPVLPEAFLNRPLAHRALHNAKAGRPENSLAAVRAAVELGYGIEIDIQQSREGTPMVFHDYDLRRLTGVRGAIAGSSLNELKNLRLNGSTESIPTLADTLNIVAGKVPLLIEVKDQDSKLGPDIGSLEIHISELLHAYNGPVAVMSFNPHSVAAFAKLLPDTPRGLTTCNFRVASWGIVPKPRRAELAAICDFERVGASFISHNKAELGSPHVARIKSRAPVICWTVRNVKEEQRARTVADNITFESYPALLDPTDKTTNS